MLSEKILRAMNDIADDTIEQVGRLIEEKRTRNCSRTNRRKIFNTVIIAAILISLASMSAYAAGRLINSPQAAEKVAVQEIEVLKNIGLLNADISFNVNANAVVELEEQEGDSYWFGRLFHHSYDVRWYLAEEKYGSNITVDTASGKITGLCINAQADETDIPERIEELPEDFISGNTENATWAFYRNFDDIFPSDMTVDRFCSLLAEYWGFSGYTLSDTEDSFYRENWEAVSGDSLLKDMPLENYYLTVFFDGDQKGVPMYLQLGQFPGYVSLLLGTRHAVG